MLSETKVNKKLVIFSIVVLFLGLGWYIYRFFIYEPKIQLSEAGASPTPSSEEAILCAKDVKICPDGSYVSRVPPECEFDACPATPSSELQIRSQSR